MRPEKSSHQSREQGADFWAVSGREMLSRLDTGEYGLSGEIAKTRLQEFGPNAMRAGRDMSAIMVLLRQFRSPLVLILIFAAIMSSIVGEGSEAIIIGVIVLASCALSFTQEYAASRAMQALTRRISRKVSVLRDGRETIVPAKEIVPGDIVRLSAGNLVPADGLLLSARDLNVSEAALTGETFPVVKSVGLSPAQAAIGQRTNAVFAGTSVRSGTATMVVVTTGDKSKRCSEATASWRFPLFGGGRLHPLRQGSAARVRYILLTAIYFCGDLGGRRSRKIFGVWKVILFGEGHEDFGGVGIDVFPT